MYSNMPWILFALTLFLSNVVSQSAKAFLDINVELNKSDNVQSRIYSQIIEINSAITRINIGFVKNVGFLIVQVHTYNKVLTLSETNPIQRNRSVNGTNIGLYVTPSNGSSSVYIFSSQNCSALVSISSYDTHDPIPGGCNLVFQNEVSPYLKVHGSNYFFSVEFQPPSIEGHMCEANAVEAEMYYYYLTPWDFSEATYFEGLNNMITVENILKYGNKIPKPMAVPYSRRNFNNYDGIVTIYAIVAKYGNKTSAYVPTASFACKNLENYECHDKLELPWNVVVPFLILTGILLIFTNGCVPYFRHFITAALCVSMTMYLILAKTTTFNDVIPTGVSIGAGFIFGLIWVGCWYSFEMPEVSACSTHAAAGFVFATFLLHSILKYSLVIYDNEFWPIFGLLILIWCIVSAQFYPKGDVYSTCFVASFVVVISLSCYMGTYMQYILVTLVRRITVNNFEQIIADLPFNFFKGDEILFLLWIFIYGLGIVLYQKCSRTSGYQRI